MPSPNEAGGTSEHKDDELHAVRSIFSWICFGMMMMSLIPVLGEVTEACWEIGVDQVMDA